MTVIYDFIEMEDPHESAKRFDVFMSKRISFVESDKSLAMTFWPYPQEFPEDLRVRCDQMIKDLMEEHPGILEKPIEIGKVKGIKYDFHVISRMYFKERVSEDGCRWPAHIQDELIVPVAWRREPCEHCGYGD